MLALALLSLFSRGRDESNFEPRELWPCEPPQAVSLLQELRLAREQSRPPKLDDSLGLARGACLMILHLYDGKRSPVRLQVLASSPAEALDEMAALIPSGDVYRWMRLDVVRGARPLQTGAVLERGYAGLLAVGPELEVWLPLQVPLSVLSSQGELDMEKARRLSSTATDWYQCGVASAMAEQERIYPLLCDLDPTAPAVSPESLLRAALAGGDYLLHCQEPEGRFRYSYLPVRGTFPRQDNGLRQAGSVYALLQLYRRTKEPRFLEGARRGLDWLSFFVVESKASGGAKVFRDGEAVKLGGNALVILAMAEYTELSGDRRYLTDLVDLAAWIVDNQNPDGSFRAHKQDYEEGVDSGFVSAYYPGEALLALVRLHQLDPDERWLVAARRAARFLIKKARQTPGPMAHDHWLLLGLEALDRIEPQDDGRIFALTLAENMLASQLGPESPPDWQGGFYVPPRSTPTDIRIEGLGAARSLALRAGNAEAARRIAVCARAALGFSRRCEVQPSAAVVFRSPGYCKGGVMRSLVDPEIRIDYVQHHISALLSVYEQETLHP